MRPLRERILLTDSHQLQQPDIRRKTRSKIARRRRASKNRSSRSGVRLGRQPPGRMNVLCDVVVVTGVVVVSRSRVRVRKLVLVVAHSVVVGHGVRVSRTKMLVLDGVPVCGDLMLMYLGVRVRSEIVVVLVGMVVGRP